MTAQEPNAPRCILCHQAHGPGCNQPSFPLGLDLVCMCDGPQSFRVINQRLAPVSLLAIIECAGCGRQWEVTIAVAPHSTRAGRDAIRKRRARAEEAA